MNQITQDRLEVILILLGMLLVASLLIAFFRKSDKDECNPVPFVIDSPYPGLTTMALVTAIFADKPIDYDWVKCLKERAIMEAGEGTITISFGDCGETTITLEEVINKCSEEK